jgi:PiT family inorganic phosphate transporter
MTSGTLFILCVIMLAFVFDFINGFHDAANSIATIVTTGVLKPYQAVIWAAFFNFIAFLVFKLMVANTIGRGLIDIHIVNAELIFAALIGAIFWNVVTWYYGLPSSSSHALIGGLAGAALAKAGIPSLQPFGFIKVFVGIFLLPALGALMGFVLSFFFNYLSKKYDERTLSKYFKFFQLTSSALLSLTHGGNDAQKTMGIVALLLFSAGWLGRNFYVPFWVVISCHFIISLGTLSGGWRIVNTMGKKITDLNPMRGCAAETGAALMIFAATQCGIPVSTTQTVTGSIAGVGLVNGMRGTYWPILRHIFLAWLFTMPAAGVVAAAIIFITH